MNTNWKKLPIYFVSLLVLVVGLAVPTQNVQAATLTVCSSGCDYTTIQAAINAAAAGDEITVDAGTYAESLSITKSLTLAGAQFGVDVSGRSAGDITESTIEGSMTINASNVVIDGFTLTNPAQPNVVVIANNTPSNSNITISYNLVDTVGSSGLALNVHAIYLNRGPDDVTIAHNSFNRIRAGSKSSAAIGVLDSASTDASSGLLIEDNLFSVITSASKGAYGVIINNAAGTPDAQILDNTFVSLSGAWTHAIGLEGPTPDAIIDGNTFSLLSAAGADKAAIHFEDNPNGASVTVSDNVFNGTGYYGVLINPSDLPGGANGYNYVVDAGYNYWGAATGPGTANDAGPGVSFAPYYSDSSLTTLVYPVHNTSDDTWYETIQAAITAAAAGDTIEVAPGLYTERLVINKALTLLGPTDTINKNGYTIPAGYAWDTSVEAVINNPDPTGLIVDAVTVDIIADDVVFKGFVVQILNARVNSDHLLRLNAIGLTSPDTLDGIVVENNVLGPVTNVSLQNGTYGRMGLYFSSPAYPTQGQGITNTLIAGNTIFDARGNGDNVFIWGAAASYASTQNADYSGTVIEDNDIYGAHRTGIEIAGGVSGLVIQDNKIHDNSSTNGGVADPALKYGNGIVIIRMGADKANPLGRGIDGLSILNNEIYDNEKNGIYTGPFVLNMTIDGNNIHDNGLDGVRIDLTEAYYGGFPVYDHADSIDINENSITNFGGYAIRLIGSPTNGFLLDAQQNWMGDTDPRDNVSGSMDVVPWYLEAAMLNLYYPPVHNVNQDLYYDTIQPAVTAAADGDVITVAAGTYTEQVSIDKDLTLTGAGAGASIIAAPGTLPAASAGFTSSIVLIRGGANVEISGFTVTGPGPSNSGSIAGGIVVVEGAYANIHDNTITDIRDNVLPVSGAQNGVAIIIGRASWGTTGTATIDNNLIIDYQKGGIVVDNTGSSATITDNTVTGAGTIAITAQNGIQISRGATATLSGNTVTGNSFHLAGSGWDWGSAGVLLYNSGDVTFAGGNDLGDNDQNLYITGATGVTLGAEAIGPSSAPLDYGYNIVNDTALPLDLTGITFTSLVGDNFAIENYIWHGVDEPGLGLATWVAGNLYVTDLSGTIQAAIDAAASGDTINVDAGTYAEDLEIGKSITILGPNNLISPNGGVRLAEAILQPVDEGAAVADHAFTITASSLNVTIKGLTVDMSLAANDDRILELDSKQNVILDIEKNRFLNAQECINGTWYVRGDTTGFSLTLDDNYFTGGETTNGISLWSTNVQTVSVTDNIWVDEKGDPLNFNNVHGIISGNTFRDTRVPGGDWWEYEWGIILASTNNNLVISGNLFDGLIAPAIEFYGGFGGTVTITHNVFQNIWDPGFGAIHTQDPAVDLSLVSISENTFIGNDLDILNSSAGLLDATPNYWGTPTCIGADLQGMVAYAPCYIDDTYTLMYYPSIHNITQDRWYDTIQQAVAAADSGDVIEVAAGTYVETGQIVIDKDLTIIGEDRDTTIIQPGSDTGAGADNGAFILVNDGITFNLSNVTLDGSGRLIRQGIRTKGDLSVDNVVIQNMTYSTYEGWAIAMGWTSTTSMDLVVQNSTFSNFGRVGILVDEGSGAATATIDNNTFICKGTGDHLDYAIEVGGGAEATITGNTISGCRGVASSDGSTSAAIFVHTYFAPGTVATITDNTITDSTTGIAVGYDGSDTSAVTATYNTITGNDYAITTTAPAVNGSPNWFGSAAGPDPAEIIGSVDTVPYCTDAICSTFGGPIHNTTLGTWHATIQEAFNMAENGNEIYVSAGTYVENPSLINTTTLKQVDLVGEVDGGGNPLVTLQGTLTYDLPGTDDGWVIENINFIPQAGSSSLLSLKNVNGVTISNCTFDGAGRFLTAPALNGILFVSGPNGNTNITVNDATFQNGLYTGISGTYAGLTVNDSVFVNLKSGINQQSGAGDLVLNNSTISVIAQSATADTYGIRFASSDAGSARNLTVNNTTITVDKNGYIATGGNYHAAIIIRSGASGSLLVKDTNEIYGDMVNLSTRTLDATRTWWGTTDWAAIKAHIQGTGPILYVPWCMDAACTTLGGPVHNLDQDTWHQTIQAAINAANAGETLQMLAGIFNENVVVNKNDLTLVGALVLYPTDVPDASIHTIINSAAPAVTTQPGIKINTGITGVTIRNLRVQNFSSHSGIFGEAGNNGLTIDGVHTYNNNTTNAVNGGGIYMNGPVSDVTINNVDSQGNRSRGIVIWNGFKQDITITNSYVANNNCCGIELQDGTASGVTVTGNTVISNTDSGMAFIGLTSGAGANLISGNTITSSGRFGIEIKLPDGTGLDSGDGSIVVQNNRITMTPAGTDLRDYAGIAVYRRGWVALNNNVDIPVGVILYNNTVSGYRQANIGSTSTGFGIVVEGMNMTVSGNRVDNNDVGIQVQAGHLPYTANTNIDGDQANLADTYFGRGNSPLACVSISGTNIYSGNGVDYRIVGAGAGDVPSVLNTSTGIYYCTIQSAINAAIDGDTLQVAAGTYDEGTITVNKALTIQGAGPIDTLISTASVPAFIVSVNNVTLSDLGITSATEVREGIQVSATSDLTIDNVYITNLAIAPANNAYGIRFLSSFSNLTVTGAHFVGNNAYAYERVLGIYMPSPFLATNILVEDSLFENVFTGIDLRGSVDGLTVQGTTFGPMNLPDCKAAASGIYIGDNPDLFTVANVVIDGNTFTDYCRGVYMLGYGEDGMIGSISITDNIFDNSIYSSGIRLIADYDTDISKSALLEGPVNIDGNTFTQTDPILNGAGVSLIDIRVTEESLASQVNITNNEITFVGPFTVSTFGILARGPVANLAITGNTIDGGNAGGASAGMPPTSAIYIKTDDAYYGGLSGNAVIEITENIITGFANGVSLYDGAAAAYGGLPTGALVNINENELAGNTLGIASGSGETIDAEYNWWGTAHAPTIASMITGNVDFNPYYREATMNFLNEPLLAEVWVDATYTEGAAGGYLYGYEGFSTIQDGIDYVADGGIVHVAAGTYVEDLYITRPVSLLGPNAGINPNTGARVPEAIIVSAYSYPDPAVCQTMIYLTASDVTFDGFTVDGDNPLLTSGVDINGADVDACILLASYEGVGGINVENNIMKNATYAGVEFYNYYNGTAATSDNYIRYNQIDGIGESTYNWGIGVLVTRNFYADVTDNVITHTRVGIQADLHSQTNPGTTGSVSNNQVSAWKLGLFLNQQWSGLTPLTVSNNTFTAENYAGATNWSGMLVSTVTGTANTTITGNTMVIPDTDTHSGYTAGYNVWNVTTSAPITILGGSVTGGDYGIFVNNWEGYSSNANNTHIAIDAVTLLGSDVAGVYVGDSDSNTNGATVFASILNSSIDTDANGILVYGTDATALANENDLSGNPTTGITNNNATFTLDGTNNWWGSSCLPSISAMVAGDVDFTPYYVNAGMTIPSEPLPGMVYVDPAYTEGAAGGHIYCYDAFSTIQDGIDGAAVGGTVNVAAGTYVEQLAINKDLSLVGIGDPVVLAPATVTYYTLPEGGTAQWEPVIMVYGGTLAGNAISGTGQVSVDISGLIVDGNSRIPSPTSRRAVGIMYRNVLGDITDCTVQNMGYSTASIQSWGIFSLGDSDGTFSGNDVSGYSKGGFVINGAYSNPALPTPNVILDNNIVVGPPYDPAMTLAPNGIQIGWGATGSVTNNTVSNNGYPGTDWGGTGILIQSSSNVLVEGNTVTDNDYGIAVAGYPSNSSYATGTIIRDNIATGNTEGIHVTRMSIDTLIEGNLLTGNDYGISVSYSGTSPIPPTGTVINENRIYGNAVLNVFRDLLVTTLNAENNWWGTAYAPTIAASVSTDVDYQPYYITSAMDILSEPLPAVVYVDPTYTDGAAGTHIYGFDAFSTIQEGIDGVADAGTVNVAAGTYVGDLQINKPLSLIGPNAGIDPNTGARVPEAVIHPSTSFPDPAVCTNMAYLSASGITIDGFTFDGDNPALTSGVLIDGADVDACEIISAYDGIGSTTIENNILMHATYSGLDLYNYYNGGAATTDNYIRYNHIHGIGTATYGYGMGILIYNNFYAEITDNVIDGTRIGIQTGNYSTANPGTTNAISNNTIETWRLGIFHNLWYGTASPLTISGNTISAENYAGATDYSGILLSSMGTTVSATVTDNNITIPVTDTHTGYTTGYNVWNVQNTAPITISGGTVTGGKYGVFVNNYDGYTSNAEDTYITVDGVTILNSTIVGVFIKDNPLNTNGATVYASIQNSTIDTNATGIRVSGTGATAVANYNLIAGNPTMGVQNSNTTFMMDALYNWWGDATGPGIVGPGAGDKVSTYVNYYPWYMEAALIHLYGPVHNTTQDIYHATIQEGVNAADPGDVIEVSAGTYYENVTIATPLTLTGASADTTFIDGFGSGVVVLITADNVTFQNFTVQNSGTNPASDAGIGLIGSDNSTIHSNILTGNVTGIALMSSTGNTISSNTINGSPLYGLVLSKYPVLPGYSTGNIITDNSILASGRDGIYVDQFCDGNQIINNTISGTIGDTTYPDYSFEGNGIYFWKSAGNTVDSNNITGNAGYGMELMGSANNTITNNVVYANLLDGIHVRYSAARPAVPNTFTGNIIAGNTNFDMWVAPEIVLFTAEYNWWGNVEGPDPAKITTNVDYSYWCADMLCTHFAPNTIVSPAGLLPVWDNSFDWTGVPGATGYRLYLYNSAGTLLRSANFTTAQATCNTDLDCEMTSAALPTAWRNLPNGTYFWRVRDFGSYGYGLITDYTEFSLGRCYTLTTAISGGTGTINVDTAPTCNAGTQYNAGTVVQLTMLPDPGNVFSSWSGGATGVSNPVSVTMDADKSVTANLVRMSVIVSPSGWMPGWDNSYQWTGVTGATQYRLYLYNGTGTLIRAAYFTSTQADCTTDLSCELTLADLGTSWKNLPDGNYSWRVRDYGAYGTGLLTPATYFELGDCFSLTTAIAGGTGTINIGTAPDCNAGTQYHNTTVVALTVIPDAGYGFSTWSGSNGSTTNPIYVTMNADKTETANLKTIAVIISPAGTMTSWDNTYDWTGVTGATQYRLYLYDGTGVLLRAAYFTTAQADCDADLSCELTAADLGTGWKNLPNGTYSWRVRDYGAYGSGLVTDPTQFILNIP